MKTRLTSISLRTSFLTWSLLTILLTSACASTASATPQSAIVEPSATAPRAVLPAVDLTATHLFTDGLLSATPPVDAQPIATSRGPDLEATDPSTVSLASGKIQFVEFFRFT